MYMHTITNRTGDTMQISTRTSITTNQNTAFPSQQQQQPYYPQHTTTQSIPVQPQHNFHHVIMPRNDGNDQNGNFQQNHSLNQLHLSPNNVYTNTNNGITDNNTNNSTIFHHNYSNAHGSHGDHHVYVNHEANQNSKKSDEKNNTNNNHSYPSEIALSNNIISHNNTQLNNVQYDTALGPVKRGYNVLNGQNYQNQHNSVSNNIINITNPNPTNTSQPQQHTQTFNTTQNTQLLSSTEQSQQQQSQQQSQQQQQQQQQQQPLRYHSAHQNDESKDDSEFVNDRFSNDYNPKRTKIHEMIKLNDHSSQNTSIHPQPHQTIAPLSTQPNFIDTNQFVNQPNSINTSHSQQVVQKTTPTSSLYQSHNTNNSRPNSNNNNHHLDDLLATQQWPNKLPGQLFENDETNRLYFDTMIIKGSVSKYTSNNVNVKPIIPIKRIRDPNILASLDPTRPSHHTLYCYTCHTACDNQERHLSMHEQYFEQCEKLQKENGDDGLGNGKSLSGETDDNNNNNNNNNNNDGPTIITQSNHDQIKVKLCHICMVGSKSGNIVNHLNGYQHKILFDRKVNKVPLPTLCTDFNDPAIIHSFGDIGSLLLHSTPNHQPNQSISKCNADDIDDNVNHTNSTTITSKSHPTTPLRVSNQTKPISPDQLVHLDKGGVITNNDQDIKHNSTSFTPTSRNNNSTVLSNQTETQTQPTDLNSVDNTPKKNDTTITATSTPANTNTSSPSLSSTNNTTDTSNTQADKDDQTNNTDNNAVITHKTPLPPPTSNLNHHNTYHSEHPFVRPIIPVSILTDSHVLDFINQHRHRSEKYKLWCTTCSILCDKPIHHMNMHEIYFTEISNPTRDPSVKLCHLCLVGTRSTSLTSHLKSFQHRSLSQRANLKDYFAVVRKDVLDFAVNNHHLLHKYLKMVKEREEDELAEEINEPKNEISLRSKNNGHHVHAVNNNVNTNNSTSAVNTNVSSITTRSASNAAVNSNLKNNTNAAQNHQNLDHVNKNTTVQNNDVFHNNNIPPHGIGHTMALNINNNNGGSPLTQYHQQQLALYQQHQQHQQQQQLQQQQIMLQHHHDVHAIQNIYHQTPNSFIQNQPIHHHIVPTTIPNVMNNGMNMNLIQQKGQLLHQVNPYEQVNDPSQYNPMYNHQFHNNNNNNNYTMLMNNNFVPNVNINHNHNQPSSNTILNHLGKRPNDNMITLPPQHQIPTLQSHFPKLFKPQNNSNNINPNQTHFSRLIGTHGIVGQNNLNNNHNLGPTSNNNHLYGQVGVNMITALPNGNINTVNIMNNHILTQNNQMNLQNHQQILQTKNFSTIQSNFSTPNSQYQQQQQQHHQQQQHQINHPTLSIPHLSQLPHTGMSTPPPKQPITTPPYRFQQNPNNITSPATILSEAHNHVTTTQNNNAVNNTISTTVINNNNTSNNNNNNNACVIADTVDDDITEVENLLTPANVASLTNFNNTLKKRFDRDGNSTVMESYASLNLIFPNNPHITTEDILARFPSALTSKIPQVKPIVLIDDMDINSHEYQSIPKPNLNKKSHKKNLHKFFCYTCYNPTNDSRHHRGMHELYFQLVKQYIEQSEDEYRQDNKNVNNDDGQTCVPFVDYTRFPGNFKVRVCHACALGVKRSGFAAHIISPQHLSHVVEAGLGPDGVHATSRTSLFIGGGLSIGSRANITEIGENEVDGNDNDDVNTPNQSDGENNLNDVLTETTIIPNIGDVSRQVSTERNSKESPSPLQVQEKFNDDVRTSTKDVLLKTNKVLTEINPVSPLIVPSDTALLTNNIEGV